MSQNRKLLQRLVIVFALLLVGCSTVGPLSKSDEKIRASILKRTPLGSTYDQVHAFVERQRWLDRIHYEQRGFFIHPPGLEQIEVGHRSIRGHLGTTYLIFFPF